MSRYDELLQRLRAGGDTSPEERATVYQADPTESEEDRYARRYARALLDLRIDGTRRMGPYDDLLARAKLGYAISQEEIDHLVALLLGHPLEPERGTLLYILGLAGRREYQSLVEEFLKDPEPLIVSEALRILCGYWRFTAQYAALVLAFMRGVQPWDEDDNCRRGAITVAGNYLATARDHMLLREILLILEDETNDVDLREFAYRALAEITGHNWSEALPPAYPVQRLNEYIDPAIVQQARTRLKQELDGSDGLPGGPGDPP